MDVITRTLPIAKSKTAAGLVYGEETKRSAVGWSRRARSYLSSQMSCFEELTYSRSLMIPMPKMVAAKR
jgi:hypothetical protein